MEPENGPVEDDFPLKPSGFLLVSCMNYDELESLHLENLENLMAPPKCGQHCPSQERLAQTAKCCGIVAMYFQGVVAEVILHRVSRCLGLQPLGRGKKPVSTQLVQSYWCLGFV